MGRTRIRRAKCGEIKAERKKDEKSLQSIVSPACRAWQGIAPCSPGEGQERGKRRLGGNDTEKAEMIG